MQPSLSDAERTKVRDAIQAAEATTAGEIFVVVARVSDDYRFTPILWATLVALCVPLPLIFLTTLPALTIYLVQLAVFVVLTVVLSLPPLHIHTVPRPVKRARAHERAVEQFLAHGLQMTEARTGALIFVSLAEHHAEIVAGHRHRRQSAAGGVERCRRGAGWRDPGRAPRRGAGHGGGCSWGRARRAFPAPPRRPQRTRQ